MITEIFTWWNRQTLGTRIWSYFNGYFEGEDNHGNRYFSNKDGTRRWVIYKDQVEATTVTPEWNNWLRFTSIKKPVDGEKYDWQIDHKQNLTGTENAFSPQTHSNIRDRKKKVDYDRWFPKN